MVGLVAGETGDLIRVADVQSYLGEQMLNIYYYRIFTIDVVGDDYLEALNTSWESVVLDKVRAIQNTLVQHVSREWRNLSNGADLFSDSTVLNGTVGGTEHLNSFTSLGFLLRRSSLATRNGYKRFGGLLDTQVEGNAYTADMGVIHDVETALSSDISIGLVPTAGPVIVKRPIATPAGAYVYSLVSEASFRGLGTQNSRKQGRGV